MSNSAENRDHLIKELFKNNPFRRHFIISNLIYNLKFYIYLLFTPTILKNEDINIEKILSIAYDNQYTNIILSKLFSFSCTSNSEICLNIIGLITINFILFPIILMIFGLLIITLISNIYFKLWIYFSKTEKELNLNYNKSLNIIENLKDKLEKEICKSNKLETQLKQTDLKRISFTKLYQESICDTNQKDYLITSINTTIIKFKRILGVKGSQTEKYSLFRDLKRDMDNLKNKFPKIDENLKNIKYGNLNIWTNSA